jgi:hypothetical protein
VSKANPRLLQKRPSNQEEEMEKLLEREIQRLKGELEGKIDVITRNAEALAEAQALCDRVNPGLFQVRGRGLYP